MTDRIRLVFTYSIALVVILGGLYIIYQTRLDPPSADVQGMRLLLAGFIGTALAFVFGRENSSSAAFQSERAYAAGLAAPTIPTTPMTVTATGSSGAPVTLSTSTTVETPAESNDG